MEIQLVRVLIGAFLLFLIVLLPVRQDSGRRFAFFGFLLGIAAVLGITSLVLYLGDFELMDSGADIVKFQVEHLQQAEANHLPKNIIIVEGSSQTELGLDPTAVETGLRQAGYDAVVVEIAGMGGNHLERFVSLEDLAREMRRRGLKLSPHTYLMMEISPGYDQEPARYIDINQWALRSYAYSNFETLGFRLRAQQITNRPYDKESLRVVSRLFQHALISTLHIGLLPYERSFDDLGAKPIYQGMKRHIGPREPYDPRQFVDGQVEQLDPVWFKYAAYRAARIDALFDGGISGVGYFSVPVLPSNPALLRYVHAFCLQHGPGPCIDAADPAIYGAVDAPEYHYNRDHLSAAGAVIYSRYFTQQLIAQGVVVK